MHTALDYNRRKVLQGNIVSDHQRPSDNDNRFQIQSLDLIGSQRFFRNESPEKLKAFEVIWLKSGRGVLQADGENHILSDNTIYCLTPGSVRKVNLETESEGYYISFAIEFIRLSDTYENCFFFSEQCYFNSRLVTAFVDKHKTSELEAIAKQIKWEYDNFFNRKLEVLKGLLNIFLIYFTRSLKQSDASTNASGEEALVRRFIMSLKNNFATMKMVSDYASQFCISANYLNRIIKRVTGFPASYHIQQQIMLEAKRQAIYSSASMKEVAYSLGFDNTAHFSKFFKNVCGMNFTDFKIRDKQGQRVF